MVGCDFDLSKARKATVVAFEDSRSNGSQRVVRPVIRVDGETATITMPGNVHEVTFGSIMLLGPAID